MARIFCSRRYFVPCLIAALLLQLCPANRFQTPLRAESISTADIIRTPDITVELRGVNSVEEALSLAELLTARHRKGELKEGDVRLAHFEGNQTSYPFKVFAEMLERNRVPYLADIVTAETMADWSHEVKKGFADNDGVSVLAREFREKKPISEQAADGLKTWFSRDRIMARFNRFKDRLFGTKYGTTLVSCFWRRTAEGGEWRFGVDRKRLYATAFVSASALTWLNAVLQWQGIPMADPSYEMVTLLTFGFSSFFSLFMREDSAVKLSRQKTWWDTSLPRGMQLMVSASNSFFIGTTILRQYVYGLLWSLAMAAPEPGPIWNYVTKPILLAFAVAYAEWAVMKGKSKQLLKEEEAFHNGDPKEVELCGSKANGITMVYSYVVSPLLMFLTISAGADESWITFLKGLLPYAAVGTLGIAFQQWLTGDASRDTVWLRLKYLAREKLSFPREERYSCGDIMLVRLPIRDIELK